MDAAQQLPGSSEQLAAASPQYNAVQVLRRSIHTLLLPASPHSSDAGESRVLALERQRRDETGGGLNMCAPVDVDLAALGQVHLRGAHNPQKLSKALCSVYITTWIQQSNGVSQMGFSVWIVIRV